MTRKGNTNRSVSDNYYSVKPSSQRRGRKAVRNGKGRVYGLNEVNQELKMHITPTSLPFPSLPFLLDSFALSFIHSFDFNNVIC